MTFLIQDELQIRSWCKCSFNIFFLSLFSSLGPRISTHSSFILLLAHLVFFWSFLLGLLMFFHCSVAMLVSVSLLCPFSVKMSIKKSISLWILFFAYFVRKKTFEYSHSNMWCCYILVWFYLYICYWCFPKDFEILWVITWVKNYDYCWLVLNLAWLSSTNLLSIFGAVLRIRVRVINMWSIFLR